MPCYFSPTLYRRFRHLDWDTVDVVLHKSQSAAWMLCVVVVILSKFLLINSFVLVVRFKFTLHQLYLSFVVFLFIPVPGCCPLVCLCIVTHSVSSWSNICILIMWSQLYLFKKSSFIICVILWYMCLFKVDIACFLNITVNVISEPSKGLIYKKWKFVPFTITFEAFKIH